MKSTYSENHGEETRKAEVGEPTGRPTIRWPSRSLDRMNANKRKRRGDPHVEPGTESGDRGQGATNIDEGHGEGGITEAQAAKRRRTRESGGLASQVAGRPAPARPSSGPKFQPSAVEWQGGNVFAEDRAAREVAGTGQQFLPKTPIPITNRTGTFKVPSPGASDWSDSGSNEDEGDNAGSEDITPSRKRNERFGFGAPSKPRQKLPPAESEARRKTREKSP